MAEVRHTEVFNCTPKEFFAILADYEKYPDFLSEVQSCRVVEGDGNRKQVEYKISVVKTFSYLSEHVEEAPSKLSFRFLSGDLFKTMSGHWELQADGEKTRAEYFVEASFGMFVPGGITKKVISANLPAMMKSYHKRVAAVYGK